jgi:hypothetical protein
MDYEKWNRKSIAELGLDYDSLNQEQIDTILIPDNAPEDYMCDGEISEREAKRNWLSRLVDVKLTTKQIGLATKIL